MARTKHRRDGAVRCVVPHPDDHSHAAAPGLRICRTCWDTTTTALHRLPTLYAALIRMHLQQGDGLHVVADLDYVPYVDAVADERAAITERLRYWTRFVVDDRKVTPPAGDDPDTCAGLLSIHQRHLAGHVSAAGPFTCDITDRYHNAWHLLYPSRIRRFVITTASGVPAECLDCGQPLAAILRTDADLLPSEITCTGCGQSIPASGWVTYGRLLYKRSQALEMASP